MDSMDSMKPYEGIEPEKGIVLGERWYICGFCMELVCKTDERLPDKCPHCGTKIKKGVSA